MIHTDDRVYNIIKTVSNYGDIYLEEDERDDIYNYEGCLNTALRELADEYNCYYDHGVSKLAFVDKGGEWCVKFPISGTVYDSSIYPEDNDYNFVNDDLHLSAEEFAYNFVDDYEENYCWLEYQAYEICPHREFLAETLDVGNGAFVQEFAQPLSISETSPRKISNKSKDIANKMQKDSKYNAICAVDSEWLALAIECYGEQAVDEFFEWFQAEGLNDLHTGNISYRADGTPCIIDFSGFGSAW